MKNEFEKYLKKYLTKKRRSDKIIFDRCKSGLILEN